MEEKAAVKEQFSRVAEAYVTSAIHANPKALADVVGALAPQPEWTVLDVATGAGHVAKALAPHVHTVYVTDLTAQMLRTARREIQAAGFRNAAYVIADAEALPFLEGSFDAAVCRIAPHHFPSPQTFVREMARVLRPGGLFLLIDNIVPDDDELATFYNRLEKLRDVSHVRCASQPEWQSWFSAAGFEVLREETSRKHFVFQPWVQRAAKSAAQVADVERFIRSATDKARTAFEIRIEEEEIVSFEGLEWMAVCKKTSAAAPCEQR